MRMTAVTCSEAENLLSPLVERMLELELLVLEGGRLDGTVRFADRRFGQTKTPLRTQLGAAGRVWQARLEHGFKP